MGKAVIQIGWNSNCRLHADSSIGIVHLASKTGTSPSILAKVSWPAVGTTRDDPIDEDGYANQK
jgi:hypothetical protein